PDEQHTTNRRHITAIPIAKTTTSHRSLPTHVTHHRAPIALGQSRSRVTTSTVCRHNATVHLPAASRHANHPSHSPEYASGESCLDPVQNSLERYSPNR
ncbi:hypothetical protein, partial [Bifidobacterium biavatii]|uniref:hypothetical protein n=1 Tax=Bifidobacterium biavatii TaxID=762212 RepID=UPI0019D397FB